MKIATNILYLVCVLHLASCMTTVSQKETDNANFGIKPDPSLAQADVKSLAKSILKDPMSAQYRFGSIRKGAVQDGFLYGGKKHYGYIFIVGINAKNSFGGYTGEKIHYFLFSGGKIIHVTNHFKSGMATLISNSNNTIDISN